MLLSIAAIVAGLALLVWSADRFVDGAASLAKILGLSPLVIGITIIGFGTSAPEILISVFAALEGQTQLAVGNAIGSNIANIGLILGVTGLLVVMPIHSGLLRREFPILIAASLLLLGFLWDLQLSRVDGAIFLIGLCAAMGFMLWRARQAANDDVLLEEVEGEIPQDMSAAASWFWTIAGLVLLSLSSRILVWGAVNVATELGISELVIGLTIVAIGTSLPELAASLASARKQQTDMAIGNVVGSNLFNTLAVMGVPALIAPALLDQEVLYRDLPVMLLLTGLLIVFALGRNGQGQIDRIKASILLLGFIAYQSTLYYQLT